MGCDKELVNSWNGFQLRKRGEKRLYVLRYQAASVARSWPKPMIADHRCAAWWSTRCAVIQDRLDGWDAGAVGQEQCHCQSVVVEDDDQVVQQFRSTGRNRVFELRSRSKGRRDVLHFRFELGTQDETQRALARLSCSARDTAADIGEPLRARAGYAGPRFLQAPGS